MATAIDEKIKALEEKLKQEKAKKRRMEAAKKAAENKAQRKLETRKKILLGAIVMGRMEKNPDFKAQWIAALNRELTRADDRELFGLTPLPEPAKPQNY